MYFLAADSIELSISLVTNIVYGLLFLFHFTKKERNSSLMILAGCLCVAMAFTHSLTAYISALDKASDTYATVINHVYLIWIMQSTITSFSIYLLHKLTHVLFHSAAIYVLSGLMIITLLNLSMHIDIIEMGNKEPYWLWTVFSYGENLVNAFMFLSILIARQWSEVFKWLHLAHSR